MSKMIHISEGSKFHTVESATEKGHSPNLNVGGTVNTEVSVVERSPYQQDAVDVS